MAYIPHAWKRGELITAEKMNNMEEGAAEASRMLNQIKGEIAEAAAEALKTIPEDYSAVTQDVKTLKEKESRSPVRFANSLTNKVSGIDVISVTDAWDAPVVDMEIDGASEQVTTTGAQLLDIKLPSVTTKSGVTVSLAADGGIHLNGTATDSGNHRLIDPVQNLSINCDSATLSLQASGAYDGTVMVSDAADGEWKNLLSVKNNATATGTVKTSKLGCYVTYVAGTTYNVTLYPMLCASPTALPWEPYTGGQPSPSPEYPQEIKGVEHVVNSGAQLFDASKIKAIEVITNVITNTIEVAGSASRAKAVCEIDISKVNGRTLYVSGMIVSKTVADAATVIVLCIQNADDSWTYKTISTVGTNQTVSTEVPIDAKCVRLDLNVNDTISALTTTNSAVFKNVMVSIDSAQPWEPYNGQQRETDLQVAVTGKNLFNKEAVYSYNTINGVEIVQLDKGMRIYNNTARTYACAAVKVVLKPNTTYTYSCKINNPKIKSAMGIRRSLDNGHTFEATMISGTGAITTTQNTSRTFSTDENECYAVCLFCTYDEEATGDTTFENIQLEEGGTKTIWEPYHEPQYVSLPLAEPLHGIGDVRDRIACKDGVWGIERLTEEIVFNGSEKWELNLKPNNKMRYKLRDATIMPFDINVNACVMCDAYISRTAVETHAGKQGIAVDDVPNILIYDEAVSDENTIDRFKAQLQTNPINAIFQSKSPVWEPFPAETQTALNALTTHPGTTYLTVASTDVAAPVRLTYVQDTRKVIDALQLDVAEQMVELQAQIDQIRVTNNLA